MAYRHGLWVSELIDIRLKDLDKEIGRLFVRRLKEAFHRISQSKIVNCKQSGRGWGREKITRMEVKLFILEWTRNANQTVNKLFGRTNWQTGKIRFQVFS